MPSSSTTPPSARASSISRPPFRPRHHRQQHDCVRRLHALRLWLDRRRDEPDQEQHRHARHRERLDKLLHRHDDDQRRQNSGVATARRSARARSARVLWSSTAARSRRISPSGLFLGNVITGSTGTIAVTGGDLILNNAATNFSGAVSISAGRRLDDQQIAAAWFEYVLLAIVNFNGILIGSEDPKRLTDYYRKLFGDPGSTTAATPSGSSAAATSPSGPTARSPGRTSSRAASCGTSRPPTSARSSTAWSPPARSWSASRTASSRRVRTT